MYCIITGNTTYNGSGGGIRIAEGVITNCTIKGNHAFGAVQYGPSGGGISCGTNTIVNNCTVSNNQALSGGGIGCTFGNPSIMNSIIMGNSAERWGGGIYCEWDAHANISNCTITGNSAEEGGGIGCLDSSPTLVDCILWDDSATSGLEIRGHTIYGSDSIRISYSDIQGGQIAAYLTGNTTLNYGPGNINADPRFVSGTIGDYFLSQIAAGQSSNSPCVDAGSTISIVHGMDKITTRTDKATDTGWVDMGYHYNLYPEIGDFNNDWAVNFIDFVIFAQAWKSQPNDPNWNQLCDISEPKDNVINGRDLAVFTKYWLEQNILYKQ
jgi:hypothetical protein